MVRCTSACAVRSNFMFVAWGAGSAADRGTGHDRLTCARDFLGWGCRGTCALISLLGLRRFLCPFRRLWTDARLSLSRERQVGIVGTMSESRVWAGTPCNEALGTRASTFVCRSDGIRRLALCRRSLDALHLWRALAHLVPSLFASTASCCADAEPRGLVWEPAWSVQGRRDPESSALAQGAEAAPAAPLVGEVCWVRMRSRDTSDKFRTLATPSRPRPAFLQEATSATPNDSSPPEPSDRDVGGSGRPCFGGSRFDPRWMNASSDNAPDNDNRRRLA